MRLPGSILQGILARSALTLLRLYLGLVYLILGWTALLRATTPEPASFLLVTGVIGWSALLVGCFLVLGLVTRLAAAAGLLLALNFLLAETSWPSATSGAYAAWAAISLALLIGAAGRTLGLDAWLAKRWPSSPFW
ncbi:MAG TPA: hypothetical protein VD930_12360 [Gemmatimonadales bacterium]|nr:hypothetical protein [Gemmatimonadales bacterium]